MKKNTCSAAFPWALVLFLCLYIGVTAVAITHMPAKEEQPAAVPTEPTVTLPAEPDGQGVFETLFAEPDWAALYGLAGQSHSEFEGGSAYAAYMDAFVGEEPLTYQQVQAADADTHRYLVYAGDEKIAAFTLSGGPDWTLDTLQLYYAPAFGVTVEALAEYTVYVNGVALDDRYTIRTRQTLAEGYLPEGVHGDCRKWQRVDGLLAAPEVVVLDQNGQPVTMECDSATGNYRPVESVPPQITDWEAELARNAAVADAQYAIGAISNVQLREYFDVNSPLYKMLITNPRNLQKYTSSSIEEGSLQVGQYCRYGDTLFSANVKLTQKIIRKDGSLKTYRMDKTYFFSLIDGKYYVSAYTNQNVTEFAEQFRLTFVSGDSANSVMIDGDATAVETAQPEIPEGMKFLGWAIRTIAEDGSHRMTVRVLPDGTLLGEPEPMTLYPVFETL